MMKKGAVAYRGVTLRYGCDVSDLSTSLAAAFVPMHADDDTRRWIDGALANPHGAMAMAARAALAKVMSDYDANGVLGTHDMRVFGPAQWRRFLSGTGVAESPRRVLDVGAGDGHVTAHLMAAFGLDAADVETTELSPKMASRLRARGHVCHELDLATQALPDADGRDLRFDLIVMLNVLDRSARPLSLLENLGALLRPGGALVVSAPLPLRPHVHVGPVTLDPEEQLPQPMDGARASWGACATALTEYAFEPLGLSVLRFSRVPYLCRGSRKRPVVVLDDAVFLLEP